MKQIIAYHGWGFSPSFWKDWQAKMGGHWQCFDRGYFSLNTNEPLSFLRENGFKIVLAHSLGLHFIPKQILASLDLLVILSSFSFFQERQRSKAAFALMTKRLKEDPIDLLQKFYQNCGLSSHAEEFASLQQKRLLEDLQFLQQHRWDESAFLEKKKVLIFHGGKDLIIPLELGEKLQQNLPSSFYPLANAGHVFQEEEREECCKIIGKQEPSFFKEKVQKNFSKAAKSYASSAHFASFAAQELMQLLILSQEALPFGPILEVGAGTGFVSEKLLRAFPKRRLIVSDLSPSMMEICKQRLPASDEVSFALLDGEKIEEKEEYAMIVSGMTLQWFEDLEGTIKKWFLALKSGGVLLFSFLEKRSFEEWENICKKQELPFTKNALPDLEKLRPLFLSLDPQAHLEEKLFEKNYPTLRAFFKNFKQTGAITTKSFEMSFAQRKKLLALCQKSKDLTISYRIVVAMVKKR